MRTAPPPGPAEDTTATARLPACSWPLPPRRIGPWAPDNKICIMGGTRPALSLGGWAPHDAAQVLRRVCNHGRWPAMSPRHGGPTPFEAWRRRPRRACSPRWGVSTANRGRPLQAHRRPFRPRSAVPASSRSRPGRWTPDSCRRSHICWRRPTSFARIDIGRKCQTPVVAWYRRQTRRRHRDRQMRGTGAQCRLREK